MEQRPLQGLSTHPWHALLRIATPPHTCPHLPTPPRRRPHYCTASSDSTIRVWHLHTHEQLLEFDAPGESVTAVTYHPISHEIAAGFHNGRLRVFDVGATALLQASGWGKLLGCCVAAGEWMGRIVGVLRCRRRVVGASGH